MGIEKYHDKYSEERKRGPSWVNKRKMRDFLELLLRNFPGKFLSDEEINEYAEQIRFCKKEGFIELQKKDVHLLTGEGLKLFIQIYGADASQKMISESMYLKLITLDSVVIALLAIGFSFINLPGIFIPIVSVFILIFLVLFFVYNYQKISKSKKINKSL